MIIEVVRSTKLPSLSVEQLVEQLRNPNLYKPLTKIQGTNTFEQVYQKEKLVFSNINNLVSRVNKCKLHSYEIRSEPTTKSSVIYFVLSTALYDGQKIISNNTRVYNDELQLWDVKTSFNIKIPRFTDPIVTVYCTNKYSTAVIETKSMFDFDSSESFSINARERLKYIYVLEGASNKSTILNNIKPTNTIDEAFTMIECRSLWR